MYGKKFFGCRFSFFHDGNDYDIVNRIRRYNVFDRPVALLPFGNDYQINKNNNACRFLLLELKFAR